MKAEFESCTQRRKAFEKGLIAFGAVEEDNQHQIIQEGVKSVTEEKEQYFKGELKDIENKLRLLKEEDQALTEDL